MSDKQWSDDDNTDNEEERVMQQPNRDFPPSEEENSEDEVEDYDMESIRKLTSNSKSWSDTLISNIPKKTITKPVIVIAKDLKINTNNDIKKRVFSPRLPPPDKYNKYKNNTNNFKLNNNDFPKL